MDINMDFSQVSINNNFYNVCIVISTVFHKALIVKI